MTQPAVANSNANLKKPIFFRWSLISALLCLVVPLIVAVLIAVAAVLTSYFEPYPCKDCSGDGGHLYGLVGALPALGILLLGIVAIPVLEIISIVLFIIGFYKREHGKLWIGAVSIIMLNIISFVMFIMNIDSYVVLARFIGELFWDCKCFE